MKSWFDLYDLQKAKELAKKYGTAVLNEMQFNISNLDLVDRGKLLESVRVGVRTQSGEVSKIEFQYEWYGIVHEKGTKNLFGKGIELNKSPWRDSAIDNHREEVNQEFAEFYASIAMEMIQIEPIKMKM